MSPFNQRDDRRELVHVNVTDHPTGAWPAQQIVETFPNETAHGISSTIVTRSTRRLPSGRPHGAR
jgi:hypothetical protein